MKSLFLSFSLLLLSVAPVFAQTATTSASASGQVRGLYDDLSSEYSDATASATPSATPRARTTTLDPSNTPVSGAVENTIILLIGGIALFLLGFRFSKT